MRSRPATWKQLIPYLGGQLCTWQVAVVETLMVWLRRMLDEVCQRPSLRGWAEVGNTWLVPKLGPTPPLEHSERCDHIEHS